jgi:hypothetical protein
MRALNKMLLPLLCAAVLAAGCSDDDPAAPAGPGPGQVPDFSLKDVNSTSATFDEAVSPRDHLEKMSAWYFGHAT